MNLIRLLSTACLISGASASFSCTAVFSFGPAVSMEVFNQVFAQYIQQVEADSGCRIQREANASTQEHYSKALNQKIDIFIASEQAESVFAPRGYRGIISSDSIFNSYVIIDPARIKKINGQYSFDGKSILMGSPYSHSYSDGLDFFQTHHASADIKISTMNSIYHAPMHFFQGKYDALVVSNMSYDQVPQNLKSRYKVIHQSVPHRESLLIKNTLPRPLVKALQNNTSAIQIFNFYPHQNFQSDFHTQRLNKLMEKLENDTE